jgi:DNA-binding response OmpR family regulator
MKRILLIDDDHDVRIFLAAALRSAGFEVATAADGKHGVALFRRKPYDLLITDLIMPAPNGFETIKSIRLLKPDIKIIAISGGDRAIAARYLKSVKENMRVDRALTKPFADHQLVDAATEVLNGAQPSAQAIPADLRSSEERSQ